MKYIYTTTLLIMLMLTPLLFSKPVQYQLFARDNANNCSVPYQAQTPNGSIDSVILEVTNGNAVVDRSAQAPGNATNNFTATLPAGLVDYTFTLKSKSGNSESTVESVNQVVCGDAYIIYGQSNAEAQHGGNNYTWSSQWLRGYRGAPWGLGTFGGHTKIGGWGMHLAKQIIDNHKIPVAIINASRGNLALHTLLPNYDASLNVDHQSETAQWGNFYKRMKAWVEESELKDGVKALLFHQGEANVYGDDNGNPNYTFHKYQEEFDVLKTAMFVDFPGLEHVFMYQVNTGCGCGPDRLACNVIWEDQRQLAINNTDIDLATPLTPHVGHCHYGVDAGFPNVLDGYPQIAENLYPSVDVRFYGGSYPNAYSAPMIRQAAYTNASKNEIVLQFDQNVVWTETLLYDSTDPMHYFWVVTRNRTAPNLVDMFVVDGNNYGQISGGRADQNNMYLQLGGSSTFQTIGYPTGNVNGAYPGPWIEGEDNELGAIGFQIPIKDALENLPIHNNKQEFSNDIFITKEKKPGIYTIHFNRMNTNTVELFVYDLSGNLLLNSFDNNFPDDKTIQVDLSKITGIKLLKLKNGSHRIFQKIIVAPF